MPRIHAVAGRPYTTVNEQDWHPQAEEPDPDWRCPGCGVPHGGIAPKGCVCNLLVGRKTHPWGLDMMECKDCGEPTRWVIYHMTTGEARPACHEHAVEFGFAVEEVLMDHE